MASFGPLQRVRLRPATWKRISQLKLVLHVYSALLSFILLAYVALRVPNLRVYLGYCYTEYNYVFQTEEEVRAVHSCAQGRFLTFEAVGLSSWDKILLLVLVSIAQDLLYQRDYGLMVEIAQAQDKFFQPLRRKCLIGRLNEQKIRRLYQYERRLEYLRLRDQYTTEMLNRWLEDSEEGLRRNSQEGVRSGQTSLLVDQDQDQDQGKTLVDQGKLQGSGLFRIQEQSVEDESPGQKHTSGPSEEVILPENENFLSLQKQPSL